MSSVSNSQVGLGGLSTSGGTTTLGSTLFGVDVNALVKNLVEARGLTNVRRQDLIDSNTAKLSAYATLESKLSALRSAANPLRNPKVTSGVDDAFDAKQTLSRASGTIAASDLLGITADSSAVVGVHSLTINRVATTDTISSTVAVPDSNSTVLLSSNATLTLNGTNVALTNTMSLSQIRDAINAKQTDTKVRASIVQASATDFRLVLTSTTTGDAIDISDDQAGAALTAMGLAASGATDTSLSALVIVDGVTATRASNSANDLIEGLSIELFQADIGKPISVTVSNDLSGISDKVAAFIAAYNDLGDFVKTQRAVGTDGAVSKDQVLFSDSLMQSNYRRLQSIISIGANGIASGALKSLRDVGIDLTSDGKLAVLDQTKFENNLLNNLEQMRALFGFGDSATPGLTVVDRPDVLSTDVLGKTITVNVTATDAGGVPTAASFVLDGNTISAVIKDGFIRGAAGTALEDFVVGYDGGVISGTPYSGTITPSQGIADQISGALESVLDPLTGDMKHAKDALTDSSTRLQAQITSLSDQLEIYRTRLLAQFQAAQNVISLFESTQNSIKAYTNSLNGKNG